MKISNIIKNINAMLAGEMCTFAELMPHLDYTIDAINEKLGACYPAFSELDSGTTEYNYIPDKYLRTVVVPGAAWRFFVADEEGLNTAIQYQQDFFTELFKMQRDMLYNVPPEFQTSVDAGSVAGDRNSVTLGERGLFFRL